MVNFDDNVVTIGKNGLTSNLTSFKKAKNGEIKRSRPAGFGFSFKNFIEEAFLPRGYPHTVSSDYTQYQLWDTIQAFFSTLSGMLAVEAVLEGIGVGKENATPLAAAFSWFTKDGVGRVTGILFAWSKGTNLDRDCKKWRLFADAINDIALSIELALPLLPSSMIVIFLCISCALKSMVGVAGSATRGALTYHQAINGNTADLCAKDGSQETVVNLLATILGLFFLGTNFVQNNVWPLMGIFIVGHLYSNFKAVKSIRLKKFNDQRFLIAFREYYTTDLVPSVDFINLEECVILYGCISCKIGCGGYKIILGDYVKNADYFFEQMKYGKKYILIPDELRKEISVVFHRDCNSLDVSEGFFHALLLENVLLKNIDKNEPLNCLKNRLNNIRVQKGLSKKIDLCRQIISSEWDKFLCASSNQNWNMKESIFDDKGYRGDWKL